MAFEVIMPKAGMAMEEGVITRWLKEVGDPVEVGEALMEIETDKINMENESTASGVLLAKLYQDGDTVPVTTVIGYIGKPGEAIPQAPEAPSVSAETAQTPVTAAQAPAPPPQPPPTPHLPSQLSSTPHPTPPLPPTPHPAPHPTSHPMPQTSGADVLATPYAKTLAKQAGLNIAEITPSGQGGVIKARDVLSATSSASQAGQMAVDDIVKPIIGMRAVIAKRMAQSHREIPSVTQTMRAYIDELLIFRAKANAHREEKLTINDFILKAAAKAVSQSDLFRTEIDIENNRLITRKRTNIAMAVSLDEGLMVPVIMDADKLSLSEISARAKDLSTRARSGRLSADECVGSVFTVSNLGASGVFTFTPIINQPNAAILGIGSIHEELALIDGEVSQRKYLMLCLTYDHRIIDGAQATVFQSRIRALLENPVEILI